MYKSELKAMPYSGGLSSGDESHWLIWEAVSNCRAFLMSTSRSLPWGRFSARCLASSDC
jgi:hypothetical protein